MLLVKLLCVGRLRERYYREAVEEYRKRLGAFCRFELEELPEERLPEQPSQREIDAALVREAEALSRHIPAGAAVCCFCVEGKALSSEELAAQIGRWRDGGQGKLCFAIGSSNGISEDFKRRAHLRLSVSRMTFPHHLFRVMAAEQLYRAFTILEGVRYHK